MYTNRLGIDQGLDRTSIERRRWGVTLFQTIVNRGDPHHADVTVQNYIQVRIFYPINDLKESFLTFSGSILQNDS